MDIKGDFRDLRDFPDAQYEAIRDTMYEMESVMKSIDRCLWPDLVISLVIYYAGYNIAPKNWGLFLKKLENSYNYSLNKKLEGHPPTDLSEP